MYTTRHGLDRWKINALKGMPLQYQLEMKETVIHDSHKDKCFRGRVTPVPAGK
jgi:hypothetical protein